MGITEVIVKVNPDLTGLPDPWKYETLKKIVDGLAAEGLKVVGLEGDPFDMSRLRNTVQELEWKVGVRERMMVIPFFNIKLQFNPPT